MHSIYLEEAEKVARQSFSMWNREPASSSYGSFDRQYWGWKYKDFSDATLQYGVRLAVEYATSRGWVNSLPELLRGYVSYCASIQLKDGSFNQCYPFERTPGVIYDILSTLIYVRRNSLLEDSAASSQLDQIIEKAVGFALKTDEKHGEVANHLAQYAYELLNYAAYAGSDPAKAKAEQYIDRFMGSFESVEGWFLEYNGPDPGYQTRCLRYLSKIAGMLCSDELWRKVALAAGFVNEVMMPDGSIHPMLGCRSTALLYPSAFEALAAKDPEWQSLAARVHDVWSRRKVPMPSEIDYGNAIRLADDALDAHFHLKSTDVKAGSRPIILPDGDRDFSVAGIHIRRDKNRVVYVGSNIGGVVITYSKSSSKNWELAYEDSGFMLKSATEAWITRMPGVGTVTKCERNQIKINTVFAKSLHDEVTPFRLIVLRILNLTLFRSQWMGDLFRKLVVSKLMSGLKIAPMRHHRDVVLDAKAVRITDRIEGHGRLKSAKFVLFRCRRSIGTHMASSRYFQEDELQIVGLQWTNMLPWPGTLDTTINKSIDSPADSM